MGRDQNGRFMPESRIGIEQNGPEMRETAKKPPKSR
jgi:hypothetical protein